MTSTESKIIRCSIFAFGLLVITLSYILLRDMFVTMPGKDAFWFMIALSYISFFAPLLFNSLKFESFAENSPSVVMVFNSAKVFSIVCLILSVLTLFGILSFVISIIILCAVLFFCFLAVFLGFASSAHIKRVISEQRDGMAMLQDVKCQTELLRLKSRSLDNKYSEMISDIDKICEDAHYLSPVKSAAATSLEQSICDITKELTFDFDKIIAGSGALNAKNNISRLKTMIAQRKMMIN